MSECPSGKFGCSCCCASVTGLRAGIHPDYIQSLHYDIIGNNNSAGDIRTYQLSEYPIHIISVTMSLAMNTWATTGTPEEGPGVILPTTANAERYAATPLHLSLTTMPGWSASSKTVGGWNPVEDQIGPGRPFITASLNAYQPTWQSPPDIFGYFCDGGLYCEATSAIPTHHGARIVVNYIDRLSFSPAYSDPVTTLQHYWTCAHGTEKEFLEDFYTGRQFAGGPPGSTGGESSATDEISPVGVDPFGSKTIGSVSSEDWDLGDADEEAGATPVPI